MKIEFYTKWLSVLSIIISIAGFSMAILKDSLLLEILDSLFNPIFWPTNEIDEGTIQFKNFTISLLGALMAMWGVMLFGIVRNAFSKKELWAWNTIFFRRYENIWSKTRMAAIWISQHRHSGFTMVSPQYFFTRASENVQPAEFRYTPKSYPKVTILQTAISNGTFNHVLFAQNIHSNIIPGILNPVHRTPSAFHPAKPCFLTF